ncbi:MAG TPA: class I SAM-dependent methyltransferase [Candidatus Paceibacterota bacterium]
MIWDTFFDEKIRIIAKQKRILDAGGGQPFQKHLAPYKELFKAADYVVLDPNTSTAPNAVVGDIHSMPFPNESFDAVICKSVLEHVEDPFQATRELYRVLKKGGYGIIYVPFLFPYHAEPGFYKDYWRFTEDALRLLCKDFSKIEIMKVRGLFGTVVHMLPIARFWLKWPAYFLDRLFPARNQTSGFTVFVTK